MTITEIIAPDGTLLLAERIPKRAAFVVLDRFQDGDWRVWTTHTTEALARRAFRKAEKYLRHNEHVVAVIPGRICATCHGTGAVKRDERYFDCADSFAAPIPRTSRANRSPGSGNASRGPSRSRPWLPKPAGGAS